MNVLTTQNSICVIQIILTSFHIGKKGCQNIWLRQIEAISCSHDNAPGNEWALKSFSSAQKSFNRRLLTSPRPSEIQIDIHLSKADGNLVIFKLSTLSPEKTTPMQEQKESFSLIIYSLLLCCCYCSFSFVILPHSVTNAPLLLSKSHVPTRILSSCFVLKISCSFTRAFSCSVTSVLVVACKM